MLRVAYCSTATNSNLALLALADILAVADRNNRRDGLTGALLVSKGRFFQVLEGAEADLDRALLRIEAVPRHHEINVVMRRKVSGRLFQGWSMVAARITPEVQGRIDAVIDDCMANPAKAVDEMYRLVDRQQAT